MSSFYTVAKLAQTIAQREEVLQRVIALRDEVRLVMVHLFLYRDLFCRCYRS
jgi:hypothetical protein